MSNLVDRFVQAQPPQAGAAPAAAAPVPKLSIALVPYAVVFGALAWVGSHLAEGAWDAIFASAPRTNPRRSRRRRRPEPREDPEDGDGD